VLIPDTVVSLVGNIDPAFPQSLGDLDYGLRARRKNCTIWLSPGYVGTCISNSPKGTWLDTQLSVQERVTLIPSLTVGKPFAQHKIFAKRYGGPFWFIFLLLPYRKIFLSFYAENC